MPERKMSGSLLAAAKELSTARSVRLGGPDPEDDEAR